jgi:2'-5' RNA ligase
MLRLFAGLSLPILLRQRLTLLQGGIEGALWTERENFHITLTFIGNVDEATAEMVDEALSGIRMEPFKLELKGTGSFAQGEFPKVLWIGVEKSEPLFRLKEKIDRALEKSKLPFENRKYVPHVTLARLRHVDEVKVAQFMAAHNLFSGDAFDVDGFNLYHSHSTKNGPVYEELRQYQLEKK